MVLLPLKLSSLLLLLAVSSVAAAVASSLRTTLVGSVSYTDGLTSNLAVSGNYVYMGRGSSGFVVIE
jgi:hypothetical protein